MAATIAHQCLLVRGFTDFDMIPDLLALCGQNEAGDIEIESRSARLEWRKLLARSAVRDDHIEPEDFHLGKKQYAVFARDILKLAKRLQWGSSGDVRSLAELGRTPWRERTQEDDWRIQRALRESIRSHYVGRDGRPVVDILQSGARQLAETQHELASRVPGLLLIELWALIYWSFRDPNQARRIHDRLVPIRETAVRTHGGFSPSGDPDEDVLFIADATGSRYLDIPGLAAHTGLRPTWVRSTAILLTYAGLLSEDLFGPVGYFLAPASGSADD